MKETIEKELEIGDAIRLFRKTESGSVGDMGKAVIRGFLYNKLGRVFVKAETYVDNKLCGFTENLPIQSSLFWITKW
jgi:hypothetical protein